MLMERSLPPPWPDRRGALSLAVRYQRERPAVHDAEGASADAGRCFYHPECVHRRQQRMAHLERLQRDEGRHAFVRADMDGGPEGLSDPCERGQPRCERYVRWASYGSQV